MPRAKKPVPTEIPAELRPLIIAAVTVARRLLDAEKAKAEAGRGGGDGR